MRTLADWLAARDVAELLATLPAADRGALFAIFWRA